MKPVIFGLSGPALTDGEAAFFRDVEPAGFILFGRNVVDRPQLRALTDSLRTLTGRDDLPILIDQEGGAVSRMKPPEWPAFPAGAAFARLWDVAPASAIEAARANAEAIGQCVDAARQGRAHCAAGAPRAPGKRACARRNWRMGSAWRAARHNARSGRDAGIP